jgi:hypothetical protein
MLTTRSRSLTAIAAGAALVAALAGCGGSGDKADKGKDAGASSSTSESSSPSASTSPTADATGAVDTGDTGHAAAPGERLTVDNLVPTMLAAMREKKTAHMVMDIGSSVGAEADLRYTGSGTDMKMSMDMGPTKASVILVGNVMYMQQSAGGKYLKIDSSDPTMGSILKQMSSLGPESSISAMKGALKKVEYVGSDTVDGDKVSKYQVTVDTTAMADTLGGAAGLGDLPKTVTYDLYVDHDHLMRRIDMTVQKQHIDMRVSNWGKPVEIKAPPASQVMSQ